MPSESTLKQYASRMAILGKAGIDPVTEPQKLLKWFDETKQGASSQKLYLSAVKNSNPEKFPKVLQDKINELYQAQNKRDMEQKLTEKQEKQFVKWEEITDASKKLAEKVDKTDSQWRQHLVMSLYTLNAPVRADYGDMKVFTRISKKRKGNELVWRKKNPVFVFRDYKTAKTYGDVTIPVSKALQQVIRDWFEHLGGIPEYLFGVASNSNALSAYIQETMKKLTGKEAGVSLIRHAYITHVFPSLKSLVAKEELSRKMLHSRALQEKYNLPESS